MRNIRLIISYDGSRYYGFQTQPGGNTIQDCLEDAIFSLTKEKVKVIGSGRTDAGVHARAQTVNFHTASPIPPGNWKSALNSRLPEDIIVTESDEASHDFHARKDAISKTYCYFINPESSIDVFRRKYELHHPRPLNEEHMAKAASYFKGTHDFTSFASTHSQQKSHVRTIYDISVERIQLECGSRIRIKVSGNGFLYNMVRIIAGTLIEIGEGTRDWSEIPRILDANDRSLVGPTAPAHGLFLWEVYYSEPQNQSAGI